MRLAFFVQTQMTVKSKKANRFALNKATPLLDK